MNIKLKKRIMMIALSVLLLTSCERCGKPASPTAAEPQYRPIREVVADMEINPVFGAEPSEEQDAREEPFPEGLLYEVVNGKTITITVYTENEARVAIPALIEGLPVTIIGEGAFAGKDLTSVIIPPSVSYIGEWAFFFCYNLTSVDIRSSVPAVIDKMAFRECKSLTSITIPSSVTSIGKGVFGLCKGLTSVTFPPSVTSIGDEVFYGCSGLTSVTLSRHTQVGKDAFPDNVRIQYKD